MNQFRLVVGLGNPGRKYEGTRHNVGFMLLDRLAAGSSFESRLRFQAQATKLATGEMLLKPQTFMNLSGRSVRQVLTFHRWQPGQMLVVYDDVALPLGRLRFREKGSAGGHNGIKSLIQELGTEAFPRLKVGIDAAGSGAMANHVLGRFSPTEQEVLENALASAASAVQLALSQGLAAAATRYNSSIPVTENPHHEPKLRRPDRPQHEGDGELH